MEVEVRTQAELEVAVRDGNVAICVSGSFRLVTSGSERPKVILRAGVKFSVVAWGSSQPHVVAWGSSQPHVVAWGMVQLRIRGAVRVIATALVAIAIHGKGAVVDGGQQTIAPAIKTAAEWCEYYGAKVLDGVTTLYKAVDNEFRSPRGGDYAPGTVPAAPDWDGGERECGGGLHFSPCPSMAMAFNRTATKFVACPVALADISVHPNGDYPEKVKARGCCGPVVEVDRRGRVVAKEESVATR